MENKKGKDKAGMIKVVIADDHEIFRDGLETLFTNHPKFMIVASCGDGDHLFRTVKKYKPDVVLTDLKMPVLDGVEAIKQIHAQYPKIICIALSSFDSEYLIVEALEAGAFGYLAKHSKKKEVFAAIETVMRGIPYYCDSTSRKLARLIAGSQFNPNATTHKELFSESEKAVIRLICEDNENNEIASILNMGVRRIEKHRTRIYNKMNVNTTAGIAIYAIRHRLFFLDE
ncbi:MAG: response regulator transcription factor [Bacteroidota bacterium]